MPLPLILLAAAAVSIHWGTVFNGVIALGIVVGGIIGLTRWFGERAVHDDKLDAIVKQFENNGGDTMRDQMDTLTANQEESNKLMDAHIKQDAVIQAHIMTALDTILSTPHPADEDAMAARDDT